MKYLILCCLLLTSNAFAAIKIYTKTGCGYCDEAVAYLSEKGVAFRECNIARPKCSKEFNKLGGSGTPLLIINGKRIDGFSRSEIDNAIRN